MSVCEAEDYCGTVSCLCLCVCVCVCASGYFILCSLEVAYDSLIAQIIFFIPRGVND